MEITVYSKICSGLYLEICVFVCVCVCVCVCACVRACVHARVCVCGCGFESMNDCVCESIYSPTTILTTGKYNCRRSISPIYLQTFS